ncbi:unnamed protein product [Oikopleura dioica]|uniref:Uncharacterized protein n=1 Tax=Oikopleura dioica TaxID=34765 RepID=E4Y4R7_OIKDI|nr:unnamed protein product [Oikopleura dioica]
MCCITWDRQKTIWALRILSEVLFCSGMVSVVAAFTLGKNNFFVKLKKFFNAKNAAISDRIIICATNAFRFTHLMVFSAAEHDNGGDQAPSDHTDSCYYAFLSAQKIVFFPRL